MYLRRQKWWRLPRAHVNPASYPPHALELTLYLPQRKDLHICSHAHLLGLQDPQGLIRVAIENALTPVEYPAEVHGTPIPDLDMVDGLRFQKRLAHGSLLSRFVISSTGSGALELPLRHAL